MSSIHSRASLLTIGGNNAIARVLIRAAAVISGTALLWASAKAQVPFWPVPMTMQTYVVLTMGALLGWRLAAATLAAYLAEGALGLPVFAGTPANGIGLTYMAGPTGGYLLGYLAAAVLIGLVMEKSGRSRSLAGTTGTLLLGEAAILGLGFGWLAVQTGLENAFVLGVMPFIFADGVKLVLAVGTVFYCRRFISR